jgi:hypothetical protein
MSRMDDREGDAAEARFADRLDRAAAGARPIEFWWRDDDAETTTSALERLLEAARAHALPLALAVVPKGATAGLGEQLAREPRLAVLQHGWAHLNHAAAGEKKIELGGGRPLPDMLGELSRGSERLRTLFGEKFLPVLVPPWNRIAASVRDRRRDVGLVGLSTFGPAPAADRHQVNTHLDILAWKPARRPLTRAEAYGRLSDEVERRIAGSTEPIGILTHHLVHEDASWDFLDALLRLLARHPAARWPEIGALFGL